MGSVRSGSSTQSTDPFTVSAAPKSASMMRCPKCGGQQEKSDTCAECGIVIEKYLKIKQSSAYQASSEGVVSYMNDVDEGVTALPFKVAAAVGILAIIIASIFYFI